MIDPAITLQDLTAMAKGNMVEHLGIEFTAIGPDFISARMPVDNRTTQPLGLLHGGASVVLAETLGSIASVALSETLCSIGGWFHLDSEDLAVVGLEINANHIRSAKNGFVIGTTKPFHIGKTTQVWEISIRDEQEHLVCISRITMAVLAR